MRIDIVDGADGGCIGLTHCPGSRGELRNDLSSIVDQHASLLVSLLTEHELRAFGLTQFEQIAGQLALARLHLPIADMRTPDSSFEAQWHAASLAIHQHLRHGSLVVLHCAAGLGRAGMIGCRLLVEAGCAPAEALRIIRLARPGAVETSDQQHWVLGLPADN